MSSILGYICSNSSLTPVVMQGLGASLDLPPLSESAGFGIGWVQDGRSLLKNDPRPGARSPGHVELLSDVPGRALVSYFRAAEDGELATLDLPPFRFRRWVFAYDGEIPEVEDLREAIATGIPEFLRGSVKGNHACELLFYRFLAALHQRDQLESVLPDARHCAAAMGEMLQAGQHEAALGQGHAIAISERVLVAGALSEGLYYRFIKGLEAPGESPLFAGHRPRATRHPSFRGLLIANQKPDEEGWQMLSAGHTLYIDQAWEPIVVPFRV